MLNTPLAAPVGIALILISLFANHLMHGYTLAMVGMEGSGQWNPFWTFVRREIARGHFPLWTPNSMGGWSLPGFPHSALFYPLSFFFYLMPYEKATTYNTLMHLIISALLMYRFLRGIKSSRYASFIGSLLWSTGGFLFVFSTFLPLLWTITWAPLFFDCARRWLLEGRSRQLALLALVAAIQFLGGSVESLVYEIMALWLFIVALAPGMFRKSPGRLLILALVMGIVGAISAVELLPAVEQSSQSVGSLGLSYKYFAERGFHLSWWLALFYSVDLRGKDSMGLVTLPSYMGLLVPIFSIYSFFSGDKSSRRLNRLIGVLVLILAVFIARDLPVFGKILYHLPVLNSLREPGYGLFIPQFLLIILTARGIDNVFRKIEFNLNVESANNKDKPIKPKHMILAAISSVALLVALLFLITQISEKHYFGMFHSPETRGNVLRMVVIYWAILTISGRILILFVNKNKKIRIDFPIDLLIILLLDYFFQAFAILPAEKPGYLDLNPEYATFFSKKRPYERHQVLDRFCIHSASQSPNAGMIINTQTLDGWEGAPNLRYAMFLNLLDDRSLVLKDGKLESVGYYRVFREGKFVDPDKLPYLNLTGVKYLVGHYFPVKLSSPLSLVDARQSFKIEPDNSKVHFIYSDMGSGPKFIDIEAGAHAVLTLYITDGDYLKFKQVKADLHNSAFNISIRQDTSQPETVIFSMDEKDMKTKTQEQTVIELKQWFGKTVNMEFRVTGNGKGVVTLVEPEIVNSKKLFQRIYHNETHGMNNEIDIYENPDAFPRAFYLHRIAPVSGPQGAIAWMKDHKAQFRDVAPVEGFSKPLPPPKLLDPLMEKTGRWEPVIIGLYKADRVLLEANLLEDGYLILTDACYPGWEAKVDGKPTRIYPAYLAFRAVFVQNPAGEQHIIEFIYKPLSFRIGLWTTLASLFVWFVGIGYAGAIQRRRYS